MTVPKPLIIALTFVLFACSCARQMPEQIVAGPPVKIAEGFKFTEGPACDRDGMLYFTDSHHGMIYTWTPETGLDIYHDNTFLTVGLAIDGDRRILACEDNMILNENLKFSMYDGPCRRLVAIAPDGEKTVIFDSYGGKKLNGLNDIWIAPDGGIYVTDPDWGREGMEQGTSAVYYFSPDSEEGDEPVRVIDDIAITNGVMGSPDGKTLYVIDSEEDNVYAWDVNSDGTVTNKRLFSEVGNDGMTMDEFGNLYVTDTGVTIYTPAGVTIGRIEFPERPSNLCFGGTDGKTLFATTSHSVHAVPMNIRGAGR